MFVDDPAGCVDGSLLAEAVDGVLRSPAAVRVSVATVGGARTLDVQVGRGGRVAWSKRFDVVAADCPTAPEAIAGSIRAGLGDLPGWFTRAEPAGSWEVQLPLTASLGVGEPVEARFGLGGRASVTVGAGAVLVGLAAEVGTAVPVDLGVAHTAGAAVEAGWGLDLAGSKWVLQGGFRAGPTVLWGDAFVHNEVGLAPSAALWLQCAVPAGETLLVSAGLRANVVRVAAKAGEPTGRQGTLVPEPWIRLDLAVAPRFHKKKEVTVKLTDPSGRGAGA